MTGAGTRRDPDPRARRLRKVQRSGASLATIRAMKSVPLRRKLLMLVAAAILPMALASAWALSLLQRHLNERIEWIGLDVARAISTAVDAELRRTGSVLETLAIKLRLESGLVDFRQLAEAAVAELPYWRAIHLLGPDGAVRVAAGPDAHARLADGRWLHEALRGTAPHVGRVTRLEQGGFVVPVVIAATRRGNERYTLAASIDPMMLQRVIEQVRIPDEWTVALADDAGIRMARSRDAARYLGEPFSQELMSLIDSGNEEGIGTTRSSDGILLFRAYTRAPRTGWITAVGLSVAHVRSLAQRSFMTFGGGLLLSIGLAVLAAFVFSRSITRPMAMLRRAALSMGRREPLAVPATDIREVQDVAHALVQAEADRSRFEAERDALLHKETEARNTAEAANRAKDEFLAMLGHELRNPLSAITGAAQILQLPGMPPDRLGQAGAIVARQANQLARLTDDLLDAGRVTTGKIVLRRTPVDLAAAARGCIDSMLDAGRFGDRQLRCSLSPVWVDADPVRLDQIICNLLGNATRFTTAGGTIEVETHERDGMAELRVRDDGIGIEPELAARVFDVFVQGERELDRTQGGLGIGLTLVRRLSELHGGSVCLHSDGAGTGSEFVVRLPAMTAPTNADGGDVDRGPARARRVLLVEDNPDARGTLAALLESAGHEVHVAEDGPAGLAAALSLRPDTLILDIGLPRMNGLELARRIRDAGGVDWQPLLIAVTGYGQPQDRGKAMEAGFDHHLVKPVRWEGLEAILRD
jgi:signal transduction histidine kinase